MVNPTNNSRLSEEDVKRIYITPAIVPKWNSKLQVRMEYYFTDGRVVVRENSAFRTERKRADYLLFFRTNIPLALVEAKAMTEPLGAGMQQAKEYAEILDIRFVYVSNGTAFREYDMLTGVERQLALADFPTPDELWTRFKQGKNWSAQQEKINTEPFYFGDGFNSPRYYQRIAINRTIEAIAQGQNRLLLVMATGTGKTYTAFQIAHRLWKAGLKKKILYLADRNILIDQTMLQDFKPFYRVMTKISGKNINTAYEVYLGLYQQLAGEEGDEPFRSITPEFFDFIIVDECHRGSAKDDSLWRRILEYFHGATQLGMTATPKESAEASNSTYFGESLYTYSLKQGIDDGFLAPYKVFRVGLNVDLMGWRPPSGKTDVDGNPVPDEEYTLPDFEKKLIIDERTQAVAQRITQFLRENDPYAKTIVFCVDVEHAERMRQALVAENSTLCAENMNYVMRITGDDQEGKKRLEDFISLESRYPVIATTSHLLRTGVDCKLCKLIVLDCNISSMSEFKQIIGRGTRINQDRGKMYFSIMDFRGACRLFADPDFDGDPVVSEDYPRVVDEESDDSDNPTIGQLDEQPADNPTVEGPIDPYPDPPEHVAIKIRVRGVEVKIIHEQVQYIGPDGKLVTESLTDYTRRNILGEFATLDEFLTKWNTADKTQAIIEVLAKQGVCLAAMRETAKLGDIDDFDLICHVAYNLKPRTKSERARSVKTSAYLDKFQGNARAVISALIDKYESTSIYDVEDLNILANDPFSLLGTGMQIVQIFGGKDAYLKAVRELRSHIYAA